MDTYVSLILCFILLQNLHDELIDELHRHLYIKVTARKTQHQLLAQQGGPHPHRKWPSVLRLLFLLSSLFPVNLFFLSSPLLSSPLLSSPLLSSPLLSSPLLSSPLLSSYPAGASPADSQSVTAPTPKKKTTSCEISVSF